MLGCGGFCVVSWVLGDLARYVIVWFVFYLGYIVLGCGFLLFGLVGCCMFLFCLGLLCFLCVWGFSSVCFLIFVYLFWFCFILGFVGVCFLFGGPLVLVWVPFWPILGVVKT